MTVRPYVLDIVEDDDENPGEYGIYNVDDRMTEFLAFVAAYRDDIYFGDFADNERVRVPYIVKRFGGTGGYDRARDFDEITSQLHRTFALMADGRWRTLIAIGDDVEGIATGYSTCVRHLRHASLGAYPVQRRLNNPEQTDNGHRLYDYRVGTFGTWPGRASDMAKHVGKLRAENEQLRTWVQWVKVNGWPKENAA